MQGTDGSDEPLGETLDFSQEQLVQEDIQKASDEDMIEAEQRVLAQVMEKRRQDRSYETPSGAAFDALVSEALQDILEERRQEESGGIDGRVDPELVDEVPSAVPEDLREKAAAAIEEAFDIDPADVSDTVAEVATERLTPGEADDVVERVAERIQDEAEDTQVQGPKVTAISLSDVDAMLQEEMKDEGVEVGVLPETAPATPTTP